MWLTFNLFLKRIFDIVCALAGITFLSPLLLVVAVAVYLDDGSPILFLQKRIGLNKRPFWMFKFRSMLRDSEFSGTGLNCFEGDPRITKVGALIRRTSIDEIPQLFNILKGEMSFIGPRPPVSYELGDLDKLPNCYNPRFVMRPGISGLAQVNGRDELEWPEKIIFDNRYIELFQTLGVFLDLVLVCRTVFSVISMRNVFERRR